jgi:CHAT domain-containing protein
VGHLDEALHLAAAMQFLGYSHVIATMWTIAGPPAVAVAENVYGSLTRGGAADSSRTAMALHAAVRAIRHMAPTDPRIWAPYVHFGN